jgi:excisionase family DNA binding protein
MFVTGSPQASPVLMNTRMPKQKNQKPLPKGFVKRWGLTKPELAAALGVSVRTVNHWQYKHLIPYFKPGGGMVRFNLADVEKALKSYVVEAKP